MQMQAVTAMLVAIELAQLSDSASPAIWLYLPQQAL